MRSAGGEAKSFLEVYLQRISKIDTCLDSMLSETTHPVLLTYMGNYRYPLGGAWFSTVLTYMGNYRYPLGGLVRYCPHLHGGLQISYWGAWFSTGTPASSFVLRAP